MQSLLPDQRRSSQDRLTLLMMIMLGVLLIQWSFHKPANQQADKQNLLDLEVQADKAKKKSEPAVVAEEKKESPADSSKIETTKAAPAWLTLGSMDPNSPYRMLVTLTNQGAAVARLELNTSRYRDVQEFSGYLGQIVVDTALAEKGGNGVVVQVVGQGTPAHTFGLQVGDRIVNMARQVKSTEKDKEVFETAQIKKFDDLRNHLFKTRPGDKIQLSVVRDGMEKPLEIQFILGRYPMDVIRPESLARNYDEYKVLGGLRGVVFDGSEHRPGEEPPFQSNQLSFLTTLQRIDDQRLELPKSLAANHSKVQGILPKDKTLDLELEGVELRQEPWEIVSSNESEAVFRRIIPSAKLEMRKIYRLAQSEIVPGDIASLKKGYHLTLQVEVRNLDTKEHRIAYQLDGPTGLPLEGGWYARKAGPGWGLYGIRDIVVRFTGSPAQTVSNNLINCDRVDRPWVDEPLDYIGVDSLYFQCTMIPNKKETETVQEPWILRSFPIRVGERNQDWGVLTDISFRLLSKEKTLAPGNGDESRLEHEYTIFAGPKDSDLLAAYNLGSTISYGWFWFVAQPLVNVLHFFHSFGMTYTMAIILLTVCVRLLMFPLSRKQALGAIKMAAIQPELKEIAEKYKDDLQARSAAQNAVFKKHNYHPASGCLPIFIQLPILIGLYKALSIDAGLYGAPLISSTFRWCNDLSAPDMLFDWSSFWVSIGWPGFNNGQGMFSLGPFFNILPMLTIVLFLIQQAIMMPPPTDEQSRMQRTMMQYMMIFMGLLFFKVPSGLCLYFIVSTLWGLAERRFIPKVVPAEGDAKVYDVTPIVPKEKKPSRSKESAPPPRQEGFFGKFFREVAEKAAEQRRLEKTDKGREKDKERKKKR